MNLEEFLKYLNSGKPVQGGGEVHLFMHRISQEALRLTAEINGSYHEPEKLRALFSQLIGQPVDESFGLFPPSTPTAERTSILEGTYLSTLAASSRIRAAFLLRTAPSSATM